MNLNTMKVIYVLTATAFLSLHNFVANAESVGISFKDADIRVAVESVAEVTGKSFVLDPRVKGKISIIAPQPVDDELLYEVFRSALQVYGFQAVEDGAVVRIVPFSQAFNLPETHVGNKIETNVFTVNHAKASEILPSLKSLLSKGAHIHATETSNHLIVTDTLSKLARIKTLLLELDSPDQAAMEVIAMQHLSTGEALHIINQMKLLDEQKISIVEDELNNRIIIGGPRVERAKFRKLLAVLDVPTQSQAGVEVIYLNHADAEGMQTLLSSMLESSTFNYGGAGEGKASSYKIEFDKANNAIVIAAPDAVAKKLKSVVRQLDRPRDQVLIEAIIAEISEDKAREISVQLSSLGSNGGYLTNFDSILGVLSGLSDDDPISSTAAALSDSGGLLAGVGDLDGSGNGFFGLINALKSDADTNILSTPSIVTLNNEEATLSVGQEVPFITGSYQTDSTTGVSNPFQTIEREEVGIKLVVTPQVNEGDKVKLSIQQESSNLLASAEALGTADVITASRKIQTNVLVGDGELLVLGGLIGEDYSRSESKVPILGSIPLLGNLFKSKKNNSGSSVLMIFIRPTLLRDNSTSNQVSKDRYRHIRQRQLKWNNVEYDLAPSVISELDSQLNIKQAETDDAGK